MIEVLAVVLGIVVILGFGSCCFFVAAQEMLNQRAYAHAHAAHAPVPAVSNRGMRPARAEDLEAFGPPPRAGPDDVLWVERQGRALRRLWQQRGTRIWLAATKDARDLEPTMVRMPQRDVVFHDPQMLLVSRDAVTGAVRLGPTAASAGSSSS